jgi:chemotaxis protein methyltransferase CheR
MQEINLSEQELKRLNDAINVKYSYDFSNYAQSSYGRRISRILNHYKLAGIAELQVKIINDVTFFTEFLRAVTVNTTEMFRDPPFWIGLRDFVLPNVDRHDVIRIWHAGCSTGEEIYSMAIMLKEHGMYDRVKIFATDINDKVLESSRAGRYHIRNLERDTKNYNEYGGKGKLSDHYTIDGDYMVMDPSLFDNVNMKRHDLVRGDIFSKFDLILCRNVIIYFNKVLQDDVFSLFLKSLYADGFLAIGSKESLIWSSSSEQFSAVNPGDNIYQLT